VYICLPILLSNIWFSSLTADEYRRIKSAAVPVSPWQSELAVPDILISPTYVLSLWLITSGFASGPTYPY
jgi:hypothetical protein